MHNIREYGCSHGFNSFAEYLNDIEKSTKVGESTLKTYSIKNLVEICRDAILDKPRITHCDNPECERCNDIIKGGPKEEG